MGLFKKENNVAEVAGTIIGNVASNNMQNATNATIEGMKLFQQKMDSPIIQNGIFDSAKGNLFEYIEAAKFNNNAAMKGLSARAIVTDVTDSSASADILIKEDGKIVKEIQAKFIQTFKDGKDTSAASSVMHQTGSHNKGWGQYDGMDRLIRKEANYKGDKSLLDEAKELAKRRGESNGIHAKHYKDVEEHLTDETFYKNATSGGTTIEEVKYAYDNPDKYVKAMEYKALGREMKCSATNMVKASFITTGMVSGVSNVYQVLTTDKGFEQALNDITKDVTKAGIRGGATGALSAGIRYSGVKTGNIVLSDSTAATVLAGGIIDGGVAIYSYALGEIDEEQLKEQLIVTTANAATTVFFSQAIKAISGAAVAPLLPIIVYTTSSYVFSCTRDIIKNAKLNIEEYDRLAALYIEMEKQAELCKKELESQVNLVSSNQKRMFDDFFDGFTYSIENGDNYDKSIESILLFAQRAGIELQHTNFDDFKSDMRKRTKFELK